MEDCVLLIFGFYGGHICLFTFVLINMGAMKLTKDMLVHFFYGFSVVMYIHVRTCWPARHEHGIKSALYKKSLSTYILCGKKLNERRVCWCL
jgi:hypothetical protein